MIARLFSPDEWSKLEATGLPPLQPGVRPQDTRVAVVEVDGKLAASLAVMRLTHFDAAWIAPEHRGNPTVATQLLDCAYAAARGFTEHWVFATASEDHVRDLLVRLGGKKVPVDIYVLPIGGES